MTKGAVECSMNTTRCLNCFPKLYRRYKNFCHVDSPSQTDLCNPDHNEIVMAKLYITESLSVEGEFLLLFQRHNLSGHNGWAVVLVNESCFSARIPITKSSKLILKALNRWNTSAVTITHLLTAEEFSNNGWSVIYHLTLIYTYIQATLWRTCLIILISEFSVCLLIYILCYFQLFC